MLSCEVLLVYPDFSKSFVVHTNASDYQLGAEIAFYLQKLNDAQMCYTTTEKELLAIVETLKEFKNILSGQKIVVYADHRNLRYKTHNSARIMCWTFTIEKF